MANKKSSKSKKKVVLSLIDNLLGRKWTTVENKVVKYNTNIYPLIDYNGVFFGYFDKSRQKVILKKTANTIFIK